MNRPFFQRRLFWWGQCLIVCVIVGLALITFIDYSIDSPHGRTDAWLMWNLRARFMYRLGIVDTLTQKAAFDTAFSPLLIGTDRPLLLPGLIASGWRLFNSETPAVPISIALFFTFGTGGLLAAALSCFRLSRHTWWLVSLLFVTPDYVRLGASQLADIPFGFFLLATVVALAIYDREQHPRWLVAAGVAAGLALSTKNEGALLLLCLAVVYFWLWRQPRQVAWVVFSIVPFALVYLAVKVAVDAPNEIVVQGQGTATFERLIDPERYRIVGRVFRQDLDWYVLTGCLVLGYLVLHHARWRLTSPLGIVGLMAIGYFFVFIITPRPIPWHVEVSLPRLILQLWPTTLFGLALGAGDRSSPASRLAT